MLFVAQNSPPDKITLSIEIIPFFLKFFHFYHALFLNIFLSFLPFLFTLIEL